MWHAAPAATDRLQFPAHVALLSNASMDRVRVAREVGSAAKEQVDEALTVPPDWIAIARSVTSVPESDTETIAAAWSDDADKVAFAATTIDNARTVDWDSIRMIAAVSRAQMAVKLA